MLDATTSATAAQTSSTPVAFSGLDSEAFMKLLIAQMRYQDPMAPSDPGAMMQQTSVLAQTEMLQQISTVQQQLLGLQSAGMASQLVGTEVSGVLPDGTEVTGTVDTVRFTASGPVLVIGDTELPLSQTSEMHA